MKRPGFIALLLLNVSFVAFAGPVEDRLHACAAVAGQAERLACFDTLAKDVGQSASQGQVVSDSVKTAPAADKDSSTTFGLEHKDPNLGGDSTLKAVVTGIKKNAVGRMTLALDNGQIWQQKDDKTLILHEGDSVLIERGALSAFYLSASGNKRIAVARVK